MPLEEGPIRRKLREWREKGILKQEISPNRTRAFETLYRLLLEAGAYITNCIEYLDLNIPDIVEEEPRLQEIKRRLKEMHKEITEFRAIVDVLARKI